MITLRTISASRRRLLFGAVAIFDLVTRALAVRYEVGHVLFGGRGSVTDALSMSAEYGLAVPTVGVSLMLSPFAFALGQLFVQPESHHVRFVSIAFFVGSFLTLSFAPALSFFLTVLAYLILGSGMLTQPRATSR